MVESQRGKSFWKYLQLAQCHDWSHREGNVIVVGCCVNTVNCFQFLELSYHERADLNVVTEKEAIIIHFNNLKVKIDEVEERWGELLSYHTKWSQEVLSIIDGTRNGDTLFKITRITNKRTKISQMAIRKRRERCTIPESSLILGGN